MSEIKTTTTKVTTVKGRLSEEDVRIAIERYLLKEIVEQPGGTTKQVELSFDRMNELDAGCSFTFQFTEI